MTVFPPGSKALLDRDLFVTVLAVNIRDAVTYEVAWMAGTDRKTAWASDFELSAHPGLTERLTIGYHTTPKE